VKLKKRIFSISLVVSALILTAIACNLPINLFNESEPTATITSSPTITPTPTLTPTPTPTPTPEPEIRILNAQSALSKGDWNAAQEEYNIVILESSNRETLLSAQLGQARASFLEGDSTAAIDLLAKLLDDPTTLNSHNNLASEAYFLLGQAYTSQEKHLEAAGAYTNFITLKPGLIDSYIQDLRGDALFAAGDYMQSASAYNAAIQAPGLLNRTFLKMKMARSLALAGDLNGATNLYDEIYRETDNDHTKALIHLRKGQLFQSHNLPKEAQEEFMYAVMNYPTAYESYSALLALVEAGVNVDDFNRGLVDYFAGEYGVALAAFDRYLNNSPSDPGTALYYSGLAHQKGGRYDQAISFWQKIILEYPTHPYWDDAWEQKGFTQWYYLGDYATSIDTFQSFAVEFPTHERAAEFLDNAARVAERSGDLDRAATLWRSVTLQYPNDKRSAYALFLSGISLFRLGKYDEALNNFNGSLGISTTLTDKARAYLWIGKIHQAIGNLEEAEKAWRAGASVDPTGYYSERARDLLLDRLPFSPPGMIDFGADNEAEFTQAVAWMQNAFSISDGTSFSDQRELENEPTLKRANELWRLGLYDDARLEYEALRQAVTYDPVLSFKLARLFSDIGLYRSAAFASRNVLDLAGLDDASSLTAPVFFNKIRFPVHFSDIIIPIAGKYQINPLLVLSLIRQESLFEAFVQSSASARGLMQIIPSTGAEIAQKLGWPEDFTTADLNRPVVNIELGIAYLAEQLDRFDGDIYSALAAYNGGPGNAAQWLSLAQGDQDLFLEIIRYAETREYIRRIYEVFSIYRRFYDRTP
jgi:soluble lytic murein transglycosylase